jgi:radical SAM superfamily enzyme YgiQ (UPF0313 family)
MKAEFILLTNSASPLWQRSIGAYQVAHHCRKANIKCQVVDFTDLFKLEELKKILESCIDQETLAVGISSTFYFNRDAKKKFISAERNFDTVIPAPIVELLKYIKTTYPKIKIIGGGANSYQLEGEDLFDIVFHGYSEQSVLEYIEELKGHRNKKIRTRVGSTEVVDGKSDHFDITSLDHQWHTNDIILNNETLPIEISRGCIFKCKFCAYPLNGKKKFDYLRDPDRIKEEMIYNYENFGVTNYFFADDTFNDSTEKVRALHQAFLSLPFKINFVTYLRIDLLYAHPEQIALLKEMGLGSAFFGIETLNHASGKIVGKGMKPEKIKEFLSDLYYTHWEEKIPFTISFIVGLPGETKESIYDTYKWCKSTPFNDIWFPLFIKTKSHYYSDFDLTYQNYGYTLTDDGWISDIMTFQDATDIAEEFNRDGMYENSYISSWLLFSILSYGITIEELRNKKIKDVNWPSILLKKYGLFRKYKEKLFTLLQL